MAEALSNDAALGAAATSAAFSSSSSTISATPKPVHASMSPPPASPASSTAGPSRIPPPPPGAKVAPILNTSVAEGAAVGSGAGVATRQALPKRLLASYLRALKTRPLRTKMITSMCLFFTGDTLAQFGIEGRRLPWAGGDRDGGGEGEGEKADKGQEVANDEVWDPIRAARLVFYGGFMFAPLAHNWINLLERVNLGTRLKTLTARVALDQLLWGPFIVCMFWTSNGILEGKSPAEVKAKLEMAFVPVYTKSLMVFGPTALINFAFVPLQHRLLVGQSVGLGWNTYMSYLNHVNNKRLAAAAAALSNAELREAEDLASDVDVTRSHAEVERSRAAVEAAKARKKQLLESQGGGATGVGTYIGRV